MGFVIDFASYDPSDGKLAILADSILLWVYEFTATLYDNAFDWIWIMYV